MSKSSYPPEMADAWDSGRRLGLIDLCIDGDRKDINLDDAALTKGEALEIAYQRLTSVIHYGLDLGLEPDKMDKESIRTAHQMIGLALNK
jgi:hypothetical protein